MKYLFILLTFLLPGSLKQSSGRNVEHNFYVDPITWAVIATELSDMAANGVKGGASDLIKNMLFGKPGNSDLIAIEKLIQEAVIEIKQHVTNSFQDDRLKTMNAEIEAMQRDLRQYFNNKDKRILEHLRTKGSNLFSMNKELKSAGYPSFFVISSLYLVVLNERSKRMGIDERKNLINFLVEAIEYYEGTLSLQLKEGVANRYECHCVKRDGNLKFLGFCFDGNFIVGNVGAGNNFCERLSPRINEHYSNIYNEVRIKYAVQGDNIEREWLEILKKNINRNKKTKQYFLEQFGEKRVSTFTQASVNYINISPDRPFSLELKSLVKF